ncbi:YfhD family protein [Bacillus sp. FJAT-26390]|uniref:YfhD family protein n=1 Tax=Bacillus sp. FJAT-26390 TaxID=1743142 RepID=UPI000807CF08|nr:YfhD family protein [Bacillus sp. FJAT-26390]OBZ08192.1 YfhD family protein [Bacillus sp. FJAT-26390]
MTDQNNLEKQNFGNQPVGKNEDVEFSEELADEADRKAAQRAAAADERNEQE